MLSFKMYLRSSLPLSVKFVYNELQASFFTFHIKLPGVSPFSNFYLSNDKFFLFFFIYLFFFVTVIIKEKVFVFTL